MISEWKAPSHELRQVVECYWLIAFNEPSHIQKIIPDGFPELIFHYKDDYLINLHGEWEVQSKSLVAGQIRKHFFLRNSGEAGMFGIKLKPTALKHLFGLSMRQFTDKVVDLREINNARLNGLESAVRKNDEFVKIVAETENYLMSLGVDQIRLHHSDAAIDRIHQFMGNVDVGDICKSTGIGERQLERSFQEYVGLPPKFYARVVRFSNIFKLVQSKDPSWSDLVYNTGFYDQSHFIRNFKAFTGEDPSSYLFEEPTMANFFLRK